MASMQELSSRLPISGESVSQLRAKLATFGVRLGTEGYYVGVAVRARMFELESPQRLVQTGRALYRYGMLGGALSAAAISHPHQPAVIDELGELSYRELENRSNALANAWIEDGLQPGQGVAIMTRNHRGFVESVMAAAKCGAKIILLNTGFSGPQVSEVAEREGADLLVYDEEFAPHIDGLELRHGCWRSWLESQHQGDDTVEALIASTPSSAPPKPAVGARVVILTSGTTGTPKGAGRDVPFSLSPVGGPLSKVPFRGGEPTMICAPMFHALGFTQMVLAVGLHCALVLHRRFDPLEVLDSLERERVTALVVVPVMLQRLLALPTEEIASRDFSQLRIIYVSGSQLGPALAQRLTAAFGPVLYNLYGSTEIAYATIATPEDLAAEPACVGRAVRGAVVKVLDDEGREMPTGETGRIFVGNLLKFEGYTGGEDKERFDGLVASGDLGHLDQAGRLFIDGRDDEMIISGGENVFPHEVEELLAGHPSVLEAAAVGVDDDKFGQRLKVFVVCRSGEHLTEDEVREFVRANLARYKVPRDVEFLDVLPRNPTGKVLKRELLDEVG
jgi:fatty-acyl-CoA synthase